MRKSAPNIDTGAGAEDEHSTTIWVKMGTKINSFSTENSTKYPEKSDAKYTMN